MAIAVKPPVNDPATDELFRRYKRTREQSLRDQIICQHLHLVPGVARRFSGIGEPTEDLMQEGTIGLVNAVEMYDLKRRVKFSTYATHLITGHIQHHLRDRGRLIRQPAWVQELAAKITRATEELSQKLRRPPTPAEVAARMHMNQTAISGALRAKELSRIASLDSSDVEGDVAPGPHLEKLPAAAIGSLDIEDRLTIQQAIDKLRDLERNVVRLFFYQELNQTEIARRLQISVNYASYLLRNAILKLRASVHEPAQALSPPAPAFASVVAERTAAGLARESDRDEVGEAGYFRERLRHEVARAQRYPQTFAVIVLDFPGANAYKVSQLIPHFSKTIRRVDVAARLGERTLGIMLPQTGKQARVLGERLAAQARELGISGARLGVAVYPQDGESPEALLAAARA